jgi:hypothetical protein
MIGKFEFKWFPKALIFSYVPIHLLEEAFGNFPIWMSEQYNLPAPLSYPHWLINNSFFLTTLLVGLFIYLRNKDKNLAFGFGILFWGFMNSMEHIVFSIKDLKLSPGFFSALLFLAIFIAGLLRLKQQNLLKIRTIVFSMAVAVAYWVIPMILIVSFGSWLKEVFP